MENDYLRGLNEALALAHKTPTAFAFTIAAKIQELVDAEERRLAPIKKQNERTKRALAPPPRLLNPPTTRSPDARPKTHAGTS